MSRIEELKAIVIKPREHLYCPDFYIELKNEIEALEKQLAETERLRVMWHHNFRLEEEKKEVSDEKLAIATEALKRGWLGTDYICVNEHNQKALAAIDKVGV